MEPVHTVSPLHRLSSVKIVTAILFITLPFVGFWLGILYQRSINSADTAQFMIQPSVTPAVSPERTGLTPPQVIYQSPFRAFRFITDLPSVSVTFHEPVIGVVPGDLTINSSPAIDVMGSGAGPYVFTGYARPVLGSITVRVLPGVIQDLNGVAFEGNSWAYTLIDPTLDADNDGANDGKEANVFLTDPTNPDTDGDGIPDGFEIDNTCLNPLHNQAYPLDYEGNTLPGDDDADDDGLTDLEEFQKGSDPCTA